MDKQDVYNNIKQAIYATIEHPDLAFSGGITTDLGTFYRLSELLTAVVCDTPWFITHTLVDDFHDKQQVLDTLSKTIQGCVGTPDIYGDGTTLLCQIANKLGIQQTKEDIEWPFG